MKEPLIEKRYFEYEGKTLGYIVKDMAKATTTFYDGIKCQTLVEALRDARSEGVIESDRIYAAALKANEKGLLTDEECSQFKD